MIECLQIQMEYEDFLDMHVDDVIRIGNVIRYKVSNQIPFSEEEKLISQHMIRYCNEIKVDLQRDFLERCYNLKDSTK
jgi:hypothetical protein